MKNDCDQLPPHDAAAEAGALGCVLSADNGDAAPMLDKLGIDLFYDQRHRLIFSTLDRLRRDNAQLDSVALLQALRDNGTVDQAGGLEYLTALPDKTPSPANFDTYHAAVQDRAVRRCALRDAAELSRLANDTSQPASVLADAARRIGEAHASAASNGHSLTLRSPDELLALTFDESDRILGDRLLAKGQSLVIAGAGSIGKSRLLLQLVVAAITERSFIGLETHAPDLRWLVLQAENSNRRLQADLAALRDYAGTGWTKVNQQLIIHTLENDADHLLSVDRPETQSAIAAAIRESRPDVICFDSLYNFAIGDLNKDEDMSATLLTLARLAKASDPNRAIITVHHALTGKAGAARATGYDRSSFGRNSKVLHSWTRGQINVAPGSADNNETLVLSCGKCSNGREFALFAARLNPQTMLYEPAPDFDLAAWQGELTGKASNAESISHERVAELCRGSMSKPELAKAIMADCGCARGTAYRRMDAAAKARTIHWSKASETYVAR